MPPRKGKQKQSAPRAAKVDRWGPDFLSTNPKSPLVYADLIVSCQPFTISQTANQV